MRFTLKQNLIVTAAVSLILVFFTAGGFFWLIKSARDFEKSITEFKAQTVFMEQEKVDVRKSEAVLGERAGDTVQIKDFSVPKGQIVEFIEELEELARITGNFISLDFNESQSKGELLFFRVTVDGSESSTLKFLKALEWGPREIKVTGINLQRVQPGVRASFPSLEESPPGFAATQRLSFDITVKSQDNLW